jgi:hypothetical protein
LKSNPPVWVLNDAMQVSPSKRCEERERKLGKEIATNTLPVISINYTKLLNGFQRTKEDFVDIDFGR